MNNNNNAKEIKAFFELDTQRYQIKRSHHDSIKNINPALAKEYAKTSGIDLALRGRNQYREHGFHTLIISKIDQKRDRTEAQRFHQKLHNMSTQQSQKLLRSARSSFHGKSMSTIGEVQEGSKENLYMTTIISAHKSGAKIGMSF